jgi:hypothetical protein
MRTGLTRTESDGSEPERAGDHGSRGDLLECCRVHLVNSSQLAAVPLQNGLLLVLNVAGRSPLPKSTTATRNALVPPGTDRQH